MSAYRAVLFDFFGTLTEAVQRGSAHLSVARWLRCDPDEMVSVLDSSFGLRCTGAFGTAVDTLSWVCRRAGGRADHERVRAALAARVAAVRADTTLRPDAVPTLRALRRRGIRTAVVSDCSHELPAFLPGLPVSPLLDARVYSVHVGRRKPHPAMYHAACRSLGVRPDECLYVGDGGSRELSGAAEAGMTAVRLAAPDLRRHLVFDADEDWHGPSIRSLSEAVALAEVAPSRA